MAQILRTLDLSPTPMVNDEDIEQSLKIQGGTFEKVKLRKCTSLTDRVAEHIVQYPTIKYLDVSDTNLGDEFLAKLANTLTHLIITGCANMTAQGVIDFKKIAPKEITIHMSPHLKQEVSALKKQTKA